MTKHYGGWQRGGREGGLQSVPFPRVDASAIFCPIRRSVSRLRICPSRSVHFEEPRPVSVDANTRPAEPSPRYLLV